MDDLRKSDSSRVIALVVRQFTPARIERQLLAQVFDLVCNDAQRVSSSPGERAADDHQASQFGGEGYAKSQSTRRATA
jgi:hypothetical protein